MGGGLLGGLDRREDGWMQVKMGPILLANM